MQLSLIQHENTCFTPKKRKKYVRSSTVTFVQDTLWNYLEVQNKKKRLSQSKRVEEYKKMVYMFVNEMISKGRIKDISIDRDDLVQTGMMYVWEAIQQYNPNRGAKESTFVYLKLLTKFINLTNKSSNKNRITNNFSEFGNIGSFVESSSFDSDVSCGSVSEDFVSSLDLDPSEEIDLGLFVESLEGSERYVVNKRLDGCTFFKEIQNEDICSVKSLSNTLNNIRNKYGRFKKGHTRPVR